MGKYIFAYWLRGRLPLPARADSTRYDGRLQVRPEVFSSPTSCNAPWRREKAKIIFFFFVFGSHPRRFQSPARFPEPRHRRIPPPWGRRGRAERRRARPQARALWGRPIRRRRGWRRESNRQLDKRRGRADRGRLRALFAGAVAHFIRLSGRCARTARRPLPPHFLRRSPIRRR